MRTILAMAVLALGVLTVPAHAPARAADPLFGDVVAFSTKSGYRAVVAWQARERVAGFVRWGKTPTDLPNVSSPDGGVGADRAQMAVVDGLTPGETYWFEVEDRASGQRSKPVRLRAGNAYNAWDGRTYTVNLLVQLDSPSSPVSDGPGGDQTVTELAEAVNVMAERLYDATDGFARVGHVLVTDTLTDHPVNVPFGAGTLFTEDGGPCAFGNVADILIETVPPFDTHTYSGFSIDRACTSIYAGREGWLYANRWSDPLEVGYILTHELLHYAFDAPDLYVGGADCWNPAWDGSIMSNRGGWDESSGRWRGTELDRNETLTPCEHGEEPWSWDQLRSRYVHVPERPHGPIRDVVDTKAVGNPDGGALRIFVLERLPGGSTLRAFTPPA